MNKEQAHYAYCTHHGFIDLGTSVPDGRIALCVGSKQRIDELATELETVRLGPCKLIVGDELPSPTSQTEDHVDCGSCRNITDGCKGKCERTEEWSKP